MACKNKCFEKLPLRLSRCLCLKRYFNHLQCNQILREYFCPKLPIYKSFDEDILGFEKFVYPPVSEASREVANLT